MQGRKYIFLKLSKIGSITIKIRLIAAIKDYKSSYKKEKSIFKKTKVKKVEL